MEHVEVTSPYFHFFIGTTISSATIHDSLARLRWLLSRNSKSWPALKSSARRQLVRGNTPKDLMGTTQVHLGQNSPAIPGLVGFFPQAISWLSEGNDCTAEFSHGGRGNPQSFLWLLGTDDPTSRGNESGWSRCWAWPKCVEFTCLFGEDEMYPPVN